MKDLMPTAEKAGALLKERRETIVVAESSTGGLISAALLAVPGASAYFLGGAVVYTLTARRALMGLEMPEGMRASTEAYALHLAKTARDAHMMELHAQFPQYGFDRHKGYPTAAHVAALRLNGVSAVHRRSFAPVRNLLTAGN